MLCVLAHPDDESLGAGGVIAKYAAEGTGTYLLTATRGEQGWAGAPRDRPSPRALAAIREAELHAAGSRLGLRHIELLDLPDGGVAHAVQDEVISRIVSTIRRVRPQVLVTFPPDGITGHPDHIAISQLALAATVCAADAGIGTGTPHRIAKVYCLAPSRRSLAHFTSVFGELVLEVEGERRPAQDWPDWSITTSIDATRYWQRIRDAVACHQSQIPDTGALLNLSPESHRCLWGNQELYRVYGPGNGTLETDLFAGLT